jgi:hypothetical protein
MKKIFLFMLLVVFSATLVMAGVTEIKLYTNENPVRYYEGVAVGPDHAANYLGYKGALPHVNGILIRIGMNGDIDQTTTPPDSNQVWVTKEAAAIGPYGIHYHFVTMPNPRTWWDIWRDDTPGYTEYLDVSSTERVTFWIKGEPDCSYPMWLRVRSQNHPVDGKDVEGAFICIDGETVVRTDNFGFHSAAVDTPFNGEWQFVSIPWSLLKLGADDLAELQGAVPYSWAGMRDVHHVGGADFDLTTIRAFTLDSREGGNASQGNYPWPDGGSSVGSCEYMVDEVVFTLNEGTGVNAIDGTQTVIPLTYSLDDNYPNPFNPTTNITYAIPVSNHVTIKVYNSLGQAVKTLVDQDMSAGTYKVTWDGTNLHGGAVPSGVYFYKMQSSHFNVTKKMLLMK